MDAPAFSTHIPLISPSRFTRPPKCVSWGKQNIRMINSGSAPGSVVVAGATGGVGRLLVSRLVQAGSAVTALVRSIERAQDALPDSVNFVQVPSIATCDSRILREHLRGADVVAICTGTTAFPTRAWRGGNTPRTVDELGVKQLLQAVDLNCIKRVVLLSSIGTQRANMLPFSILNLFGVLSAKRKGELALIDFANLGRVAYAIVRPGRLIGAPHTNVGMLQSEEDPFIQGVRLEQGDSLSGVLSRDTAAQAMFLATKWPTDANLDFCAIQVHGDAPNRLGWYEMMRKVQILRNTTDREMNLTT